MIAGDASLYVEDFDQHAETCKSRIHTSKIERTRVSAKNNKLNVGLDVFNSQFFDLNSIRGIIFKRCHVKK